MGKVKNFILGSLVTIPLGASIAYGAVAGVGLEKYKKENADLTATNITISTENENVNLKLTRLTKEKEDLEKSVLDLQEALALANSNLDLSEEEINTLNATIENLNLRITELEQQIEDLTCTPTSASLFTFEGGVLTGYIGEEKDIFIPSSYSLGPIYTKFVEETFKDFSDVVTFAEGASCPFDITWVDSSTGESKTETIEVYYETEFHNFAVDTVEYPCTISYNKEIQTYIDGNDFEVTSIDINAFINNHLIESVIISENVTSIPYGTFKYCKNLKSIKVDKNNESYCSIDGILYNKTITTLISCPTNIERYHLVIPNTVTAIWMYAFANNQTLDSIVIPKSVVNIGRCAFINYTGYTSSLTNVYYEGTEEEWGSIVISAENSILSKASRTYNYVIEE